MTWLWRLLFEEHGWGKVWTGLGIAICLAGGGIVYQRVSPGGGGTNITCDQSSTSSGDFATDLSAISNGQTICLTNAVDYGTFSGTTKNITIVSQAGSGSESPVNATLALNLGSGDTGTVVIDGGRNTWNAAAGLNIPTAVIANGATNLTIKDFEINGTGGSGRRWQFDPSPLNANIVVDHFNAHDVTCGEALFYFDSPAGPTPSGVTIKRGVLRHFSNDGFKLGAELAITVTNNKLIDFHDEYSTCDANHTDAMQFFAGTGSTVRGNWVYDASQCISGFDGMGSASITHNAVVDCDAHAFTLMGDDPASTLAWDTIGVGATDGITCGDKTGFAIPSLTSIYNNVTPGGVTLTGGGATCTPTRNDHNVTAAVTYVGGSDPTTFDTFSDFCLTPASAGYTGADDSGQVGVCGGDYNSSTDGPPAGEGY